MNRLDRTSSLNFIIVFILFSLTCCADRYCPDRDKFIQSFTDFSNDVSKHYEAFEVDDWKKLDKEYKHYVDICYPKFKPELTVKDKVVFLKQTFIYNVYREENNNAPEVEQLHTIDLDQEIEELGDAAQKELENYIKDNLGKELEKAVDDILDGLNQIGGQIKDWLKPEKDQ